MRGAHANIAFELTLSVKQTTARVRTLRRFYLTSATVGDVARRVVLGRAGGGGDLGWRGVRKQAGGKERTRRLCGANPVADTAKCHVPFGRT